MRLISLGKEEILYEYNMKDGLTIHSYGTQLVYIEDETKNQDIVIKAEQSKYNDYKVIYENGSINIYVVSKNIELFEIIRDFIEDINSKQIRNYYEYPTLYVQTSKENIEKLMNNLDNEYKKNNNDKIEKLYSTIDEKEEEIFNLKIEIEEKNQIIEEYKTRENMIYE